MKQNHSLEVVFWSIALPGFGQLINGHLIKGIVFIFLEVLINVTSNFNTVIMLSFLGDIQGAIEQTNYQWLMFYPCLYMYAIWDAYKFSKPRNQTPFSFLPVVFAAYFVTVGLMYSYRIKLFGYVLGPVWLPILSVVPGLLVGYIIKRLLLFFSNGMDNKV